MFLLEINKSDSTLEVALLTMFYLLASYDLKFGLVEDKKCKKYKEEVKILWNVICECSAFCGQRMISLNEDLPRAVLKAPKCLLKFAKKNCNALLTRDAKGSVAGSNLDHKVYVVTQ